MTAGLSILPWYVAFGPSQRTGTKSSQLGCLRADAGNRRRQPASAGETSGIEGLNNPGLIEILQVYCAGEFAVFIHHRCGSDFALHQDLFGVDGATLRLQRGAAITPWLVQHSETWYQTLAWWALPAVVALFAWWWQSAREVASSHKTTTTPVRVVFTPRAWTLGVYFGLINGGYASLIAWLPAFYIEIGASAQYSGSLLALMTLGQAAGALLMPAMARHQDRRKLLMLALVLQLVGFCGFIWLPMQLPVLWAMVCGLGLGGAFPLCLLLALDHSVQPAIAGKLVAFMQGIGFIIAGLAPWFSGVLRSISGNYLMDWAFHALCVVGLMIITLRFAPVHFPQLWVKEA